MSIFKACDIRGEFGAELQISHAVQLGAALRALQGPVTVLVAGDARVSTPALQSALIDSLLRSGCDVVDLGAVLTPLFYFARLRLGIQTGVMVTASHNPASDNGFKLTLGPLPVTQAEMDRLAAQHLRIHQRAVLVRADTLAGLHQAVARRLVRRALALAKGDLRSLEFRHVRAVLDLAQGSEGHGRTQVPGVDVFRSFEWLRLEPLAANNLEHRNFRIPVPVPGRVSLPDGETEIQTEVLDISTTTGALQSVYNGLTWWLDWDRVAGSVEVRNWRPGDQYRRLGHSSQEKVKQLFQHARIPLWERRKWPVVTCGDAIVWVRLFGPAADFAARPESQTILAIRETSPRGE